MCVQCEQLEQQCATLRDECSLWQKLYDPEGHLPPGATARHLRLVLLLNRINRRHVESLRASTHSDARELYEIISRMTGL